MFCSTAAPYGGDGVNDRLLTGADVAELLRVSEKTVKRLPIPKVTLGKRTIRYELADVQRYIEGRKLVVTA